MYKYSMKSIWRARQLILDGYAAKEVSSILNIPVDTIRKYTKAERAKVKEQKHQLK